LIHHFGRAFLEGDEGERVSIRDFDGFGETEAIDPEGEDRLDFVDEQDRGDAFDVHGFDLLSLDSDYIFNRLRAFLVQCFLARAFAKAIPIGAGLPDQARL
jgi:hypothetical protein